MANAAAGVTRGRLAPTTSGHLHIGNARSFLAAWLAARAVGGQVVLRLEDIDRERCRAEFEPQQIADLRWLGLDWDEGPDVGGPCGPYRQSERLELYAEALRRLIAAHAAYPCTCTRRDIAASAPQGDDDERVYPDTCRGRWPDADAARAASGRDPVWRLLTDATPMEFTDGVFGPQAIDAHGVSGDFVVMRRDGWPAYQLAVAVDDAAMGVTQVVRGSDLLASTARQLLLYRALGLQAPQEWIHLPLVHGGDGSRLAKRAGGLALRALREAGVAPEQLVGVLGQSLGLLERAEPVAARELMAIWDARRIPKTSLVLNVAAFGGRETSDGTAILTSETRWPHLVGD